MNKLTIIEEDNINAEMETDNLHDVSDDDPDDVCDVFTYDEFKDWIEGLMKNDR